MATKKTATPSTPDSQLIQNLMFDLGKETKRKKQVMNSKQAVTQAKKEHPDLLAGVSEDDLHLFYQLGYIWS